MNNKMGGIREEPLWPISTYYNGIYVIGLRKTTETSQPKSQPEFEAKASIIQSRNS